MSGTTKLVVAGGVQQMSALPISSAMLAGQAYGFDDPFSGSTGWQKRYGDQEVGQFRGAEMIAEHWDISRGGGKHYAVEFARGRWRLGPRAASTTRSCRWRGSRPTRAGEPNLEKIRSLPTLVEGGRLTAALASLFRTASAAMLVASEAAVRTHGLKPRARVHHLSVRGEDPIRMLSARSRPPGMPSTRRGCPWTTSTWWRSTRRSPRW